MRGGDSSKDKDRERSTHRKGMMMCGICGHSVPQGDASPLAQGENNLGGPEADLTTPQRHVDRVPPDNVHNISGSSIGYKQCRRHVSRVLGQESECARGESGKLVETRPQPLTHNMWT